jgi:ubiquinone/menaquinone biosynthesis C-methylase UbiE
MPNSSSRTDADAIKEAYASDEHLSVRIRTHERFTRPPIDFPKWVIDTRHWRGNEWVLDVGAGPGTYFDLVLERVPQGRLVAGDLSYGMLQQARRNARAAEVTLLNLDAQNLPFADGTFDVVLANHMLYHVPDIDAALSEIRRVLKWDGCLIAATNSQSNLLELDTLTRRALTLLGFPKAEPILRDHDSFFLENGSEVLAHYFRAVARYDLPSALHFPEVEPVLAYLNSMQALRAPYLPEDITWDDYIDVMEKQITRLIRHFGELEVQKLAGVLVGTNGGGFAADYFQRLDSERR